MPHGRVPTEPNKLCTASLPSCGCLLPPIPPLVCHRDGRQRRQQHPRTPTPRTRPVEHRPSGLDVDVPHTPPPAVCTIASNLLYPAICALRPPPRVRASKRRLTDRAERNSDIIARGHACRHAACGWFEACGISPCVALPCQATFAEEAAAVHDCSRVRQFCLTKYGESERACARVVVWEERRPALPRCGANSVQSQSRF